MSNTITCPRCGLKMGSYFIGSVGKELCFGKQTTFQWDCPECQSTSNVTIDLVVEASLAPIISTAEKIEELHRKLRLLNTKRPKCIMEARAIEKRLDLLDSLEETYLAEIANLKKIDAEAKNKWEGFIPKPTPNPHTCGISCPALITNDSGGYYCQRYCKTLNSSGVNDRLPECITEHGLDPQTR